MRAIHELKIMPSLPAKPASPKQCKKKQNPRNVMGMSLFDKARVEVLHCNITTVDKKMLTFVLI